MERGGEARTVCEKPAVVVDTSVVGGAEPKFYCADHCPFGASYDHEFGYNVRRS